MDTIVAIYGCLWTLNDTIGVFMRLQLFVDEDAGGSYNSRITTTDYLAEDNNIYSLLSYISSIMQAKDGFIRHIYLTPIDQFGRRFIYGRLGRDHYHKTNYYIM
jgi:hypothetical protein